LLQKHFGELQNLPQKSPVFANGHEIDEYLRQATELNEYIVIKVHFPGPFTIGLIERGVLKTITTYRDPRDCVVSLRNLHRWTTDEAAAWVERNLKYFDIYHSAPKNLFLRYDDVLSKPIDTAKKIMDFLGMNANFELLRQICQETDLKRALHIQKKLEKQSSSLVLKRWLGLFLRSFRRQAIDTETRIFIRHVQNSKPGRWRDELSDRQAKELTRRFRPWIEELGYDV
jgi:hypothetical protein